MPPHDLAPQAITLIGMSGIGKTWLSEKLKNWGWAHYSCDLEIGQNYLAEHIGPVSVDDLSALSNFIGKLGHPGKGGLSLDEFRIRQKLYYDAERQSLYDALDKIDVTNGSVVIDSSGSLCEIDDEALMEKLGAKTRFVYLKASEEQEHAVLQRAKDYPKPLFFPPKLFPQWLEEYQADQNMNDPNAIDPDEFAIWVFPKLFQSRLPKYQALAERYGITINTSIIQNAETNDDFIKAIGL